VAEGTLRPVWDKVGVVEYDSGDRYTGELSGDHPSEYGVGDLAGTRATCDTRGSGLRVDTTGGV